MGVATAANYMISANASADYAAHCNPLVAGLPDIVSEFFTEMNREMAVMTEGRISGASAGLAQAAALAGKMPKFEVRDVVENDSAMSTNRGLQEHGV